MNTHYELYRSKAPIAWQEAFHMRMQGTDAPRFVLLSGGLGSGKTVANCVEMIGLCLDNPGIRITAMAEYDYYFDEFFLPCFNLTCYGVEGCDVKRRKVKFDNGSVIEMMNRAKVEKKQDCIGDCIFWMEAAYSMTGREIALFDRLVLMQNIGERQGFPMRFYFDQNPNGHNWTWNLFIEPNSTGDTGTIKLEGEEGQYREYEHATQEGTFLCISSSSKNNRHLPPRYVSSISRDDDPPMVERKVNGSFEDIRSSRQIHA